MQLKNVQSETKNIPKLRFPGFSGAWEEKKLRDVGDIVGGGTPDTTKEEYWSGEVNWFTPTEIKQKYVSESVRKISEAGLSKSSARLLPAGTLLLTTRATIGDVSISKKESTTNQGFQSIITNEENSNEFLYNWILKNKKAFLRRASGSTFPEIAGKEVEKIKINLPSLPEQRKITNFLGLMDGLIENLGAQKEKLEDYKKGTMQKLFNQEIRFKDDKGKDFLAWEEKTLGDIAEFLKGKGISKADIIKDGKNKCIRYGELYTRYNEIIEDVISYTNISKERSVLSKKNDILMPSSGETPLDIATASCIKEDDVLLGGDLNIIRFKKQNGGYLAYYLSNFININIARLAQGHSVVHLYSSTLRTLKINIPSLPEQKKIADFLISIDNLIELKQEQIAQAETWKKGLMQGLFV